MLNIAPNELLPHREPMLLVRGILEVDLAAGYIKASAGCTEKDILYDARLGGVSTNASIEIMAQTIGLLSGYTDKLNSVSIPGMGKLLSVKQYHSYAPALPINTPLQAEARLILLSHPIGVYECRLSDGDTLLAEAEITVIRDVE